MQQKNVLSICANEGVRLQTVPGDNMKLASIEKVTVHIYGYRRMSTIYYRKKLCLKFQEIIPI